MASRIKTLLHKSVVEWGEKYATMWGTETALSAGIAALELLSPEGREIAVKIARGLGEGQAKNHYKLLSPADQELLRQIRKSLAPEETPSKRKVGS